MVITGGNALLERTNLYPRILKLPFGTLCDTRNDFLTQIEHDKFPTGNLVELPHRQSIE